MHDSFNASGSKLLVCRFSLSAVMGVGDQCHSDCCTDIYCQLTERIGRKHLIHARADIFD